MIRPHAHVGVVTSLASVLVLGGCSSTSDERVTLAFTISGLTGASIEDVRTLTGDATLKDESGAVRRFFDATIADCGYEPETIRVRWVRIDIPTTGGGGVTRFEDVVSGPLTVAVARDGDDPFEELGAIESPQGRGPLDLDVPGSRHYWNPLRWFFTGAGRIRMRAETHRSPADEFSLDVRIEFELGDVVCQHYR